MYSLYLHIGPHKTGTSYLQRVFFENRRELRQLGVIYPETENFHGHHHLVQLIKSRAGEQVRNWMRIDDDYSKVLVSSENFSLLNRDDLKFFNQCIDSWSVLIVYFKRNPVDLLLSSWQETVKHGVTSTFAEQFSGQLINPASSRTFNHCLVLDVFEEVYGIDAIRIIDYDVAMAREGILEGMLGVLDLPSLSGFRPKARLNPSLELHVVELLRALNSIAEHRGELNRANVRQAFLASSFQQENRELIDALLSRILELDNSQRFILRQSTLERMANTSEIEGCAKKFGLSSGGALDKRKEMMIPTARWLTGNGVIGELEDLYRRLKLNA